MKTLPAGVTYTSPSLDDRTFPYLTTENIHRLQAWFDEMEQQVAQTPDELLNIRLLRRELDFAALRNWFDLKKAHPEVYTDPAPYADGITETNRGQTTSGGPGCR